MSDEKDWPRLTWSATKNTRVLAKTRDGEWCYVGGLGAMGVGEMWMESQFCTSFEGFDTVVVLERRGNRAVPEGTPDTITITISREDAEFLASQSDSSHTLNAKVWAIARIQTTCRAALEGER